MRRDRWPAAAGVVLLAAALAAEAAWVAPLRAERRAAEAIAPPAVPRAALAPPAAEARLADFHAALPALDALDGVLAGMDEAAREAGVPLRSAEYRLEERAGEDDGRIARYRIALRTAGSYGRIRAFLGRWMERQPSVALDDVQFRRAPDAALEADARLTVHLRRP